METVTAPTVQELNADAERLRRHDARLRAMHTIVAKFNKAAKAVHSHVYLQLHQGNSVKVLYDFQYDWFVQPDAAFVENLLSPVGYVRIQGMAAQMGHELTWNNDRTIFWLSLGVNQKVAK